MHSKMKWIVWLPMAVLLPNCASNAYNPVSPASAQANHSALYDPPTVTMIDGTVYNFKEGCLTGSGQRWHSDYSYRRAVIIGSK